MVLSRAGGQIGVFEVIMFVHLLLFVDVYCYNIA